MASGTTGEGDGRGRQAESEQGTRRGLWGSLRAHLGPRSEERRGRGELRIVETFALVLVGIFLAVATINDLVREVHIGKRLAADLASWQAIMDSKYHNPKIKFHNPLVEQNVTTFTTRDVVCANTAPVKPLHTVQICLIFTGPVHHERRQSKGGYYLLAEGTDIHEPVLDYPQYRYGCFGTAVAEKLCGLSKAPPGEPDTPLIGGT